MKKLIALTLALILCLGLIGCGSSKSEEALHVEGLIDAIGTVTKDSEFAIIQAETEYEWLWDEARAEVENYDTLVAARAAFDGLYTNVELSMDNWQEYLELAVEEVWSINDFEETDRYTSTVVLRVKEEYKDLVDYVNINLVAEVEFTTRYRYYSVDWDNRTMAFDSKKIAYMDDKVDRMTFSYENYRATGRKDMELALMMGYMNEAELDKYALETLNYDLSRLYEFSGNMISVHNDWVMNGKPVGTYYDSCNLLRIKGTIPVIMN